MKSFISIQDSYVRLPKKSRSEGPLKNLFEVVTFDRIYYLVASSPEVFFIFIFLFFRFVLMCCGWSFRSTPIYSFIGVYSRILLFLIPFLLVGLIGLGPIPQ